MHNVSADHPTHGATYQHVGRIRGKTSAGHGHGLAFVDAVARAHRGNVEAMNRETGGARIAVSLPLAKAKTHLELTTTLLAG